ncbi:MAG TPA: GNAT family N-acetyltransferase [Azospirillum sp.]|nr:GNAT family N-acetyltransferase [Azospirillum sp.]
MNAISAHVVDVRREAFWPAVAEHRLGSLFSSPLWGEALARTYGFDISASTATRRGSVESAILFACVSDMRGDRVVSLPFSDYCDPLVEDADAWSELLEPILAMGVPVSFRCLHHEVAPNDPRFTVMGHALWHDVDLTRSEDELWAGLSGSARQNVRKAMRNGIVVREARDMEAVRTFHRMHCHLRKTKYRMLAQPIGFFENLHELFSPGDRLTVLLAERDGDAVAGIVFLEWGDTLYYKFNASLDPVNCPNDLLAWEGIRYGNRRGLCRLDFGVSDLDQPGLIRYKRKYAARERTATRLRWLPPGHADARGEQAGRTFGRLTELFTRPDVPDDVTAAAGNELYRYFC